MWRTRRACYICGRSPTGFHVAMEGAGISQQRARHGTAPVSDCPASPLPPQGPGPPLRGRGGEHGGTRGRNACAAAEWRRAAMLRRGGGRRFFFSAAAETRWWSGRCKCSWSLHTPGPAAPRRSVQFLFRPLGKQRRALSISWPWLAAQASRGPSFVAAATQCCDHLCSVGVREFQAVCPVPAMRQATALAWPCRPAGQAVLEGAPTSTIEEEEPDPAGCSLWKEAQRAGRSSRDYYNQGGKSA